MFLKNGLVSFYQHSQPEQGIVNSTSAKLLINASNPYIFLNGNKRVSNLWQFNFKTFWKF